MILQKLWWWLVLIILVIHAVQADPLHSSISPSLIQTCFPSLTSCEDRAQKSSERCAKGCKKTCKKWIIESVYSRCIKECKIYCRKGNHPQNFRFGMKFFFPWYFLHSMHEDIIIYMNIYILQDRP